MNSVLLRGRVGKQPEVRHTNGGSTVASFSMATNESYYDKQGQKQESASWHNIVTWGNLAEAVGVRVSKGTDVVVLGKLKTRKYTDKAGVEKYTTEVIAEGVFVGLDRVQQAQQGQQAPQRTQAPQQSQYPEFPGEGEQDDLGITL